eukprot:TRINITY_DN3841_c0_g2_i1.p1 TRINITY_DN3841_c0_g2~~TRINITY_DN3841_c0_g2_i1.p1  ORF type:complete len:398 (+),score=38.00 TRINITY_DN3841_c0_g2_i1:82-1194(+)
MHYATSLAFVVLSCAFANVYAQNNFEILFEPRGLFSTMMHSGLQTSTNSREAELDRVLSSLSHGGSSKGVDAVPKESVNAPQPQHSFPVQMIRDLFPGPWLMGQKAEHPVPFEQPDPLVKNLMQGLDTSVVGLMTQAQVAAGRDRLPNSCNQDLAAWCQGAPSQLHCLGQHADAISSSCRSDVGKSVPFRCSSSIDKFCSKVETGILDCLGARVVELPEDCRDAVLATHHVLSKASTHTVTLVDLDTGSKQQVASAGTAGTPAPLLGAPHPATAPHELPKGVLNLLGLGRGLGGQQSSRMSWPTLCALVIIIAAVAYYSIAGTTYEKRLHVFLASFLPKDFFVRKTDGSSFFSPEFELSKSIDPGFTPLP